MNEYLITQRATELKSKNLLTLVAAYIGIDHIALKFWKFEMSLREYLDDHIDTL